jgi:hypothetical protein
LHRIAEHDDIVDRERRIDGAHFRAYSRDGTST